jgi:hypothetical protein
VDDLEQAHATMEAASCTDWDEQIKARIQLYQLTPVAP